MHDGYTEKRSSKAEQLLEFLVKTSYHESPTAIYHLSSGKWSQYYIDCKMALSYSEARKLTAELILEKLTDGSIDAVGGLALGAYPIAIAVSDLLSHQWKKDIRAFIVRKDPKTHGLQKYLEGDVHPGERVLIVDDVITTGGSTLTAIEKSRDADLTIIQAIAIIDREEDKGRQRIEKAGVAFDAIFTLSDLRQASKYTSMRQ